MVGRYRVAEPLGAGSFASVFRGVHDETGESVAIKSVAIARLTEEVGSRASAGIFLQFRQSVRLSTDRLRARARDCTSATTVRSKCRPPHIRPALEALHFFDA